MQSAGALAASDHPGLTTASILDGAPQISPVSSPLGTSPESRKPVELLGLGLPSWSAGPIPKAPGRGSAPLLLAYYDPDGRLVYAGRAGTGINQAELEWLWRKIPAAIDFPDAARGAAAARQPLRLAFGA